MFLDQKKILRTSAKMEFSISSPFKRYSNIFDFVGGFGPPPGTGILANFCRFFGHNYFLKTKKSGFFGCIVTYKNRGNFWYPYIDTFQILTSPEIFNPEVMTKKSKFFKFSTFRGNYKNTLVQRIFAVRVDWWHQKNREINSLEDKISKFAIFKGVPLRSFWGGVSRGMFQW